MAKKKKSKKVPGQPSQKDDAAAQEKREAICKMWKKRLKRAHDHQQTWWRNGRSLKKFIEGDQWSDEEDWHTPDVKWSRTTNNRLWSLVQGYLSTLVHQRPNVTAKPVRDGEDAIQRAQVNSRFMNYVLRETKYEEHTRLAVQDAIIYGVGFKEQGVDRERGDIPKSRWVSAEDVLVDPEANTVISSVGWIARKVTMKLSTARRVFRVKDLKGDKGIAGDEGEGKQPSSTGKASEHVGGGDEDEVVTLYRIYVRGDDPAVDDTEQSSKGNKSDLKRTQNEDDEVKSAVQAHIEKSGNRILTVSMNHPEILDERPWPFVLDHDEFPITPFRVHVVAGAFLTHSVLKPLRPLQKQLNWATTFAITRMRNSAQRKWLVNKQGFQGGEEELEKLTSKNDDEVIETSGRIAEAIQALELDALPTTVLQMLPILQQQFDEISGFQELFGPMKSARSATEADIRDQRAQTNSALMLQSIENGMTEDVRHMLQIAFSVTPLDKVADVVGKNELIAEIDPLTQKVVSVYWDMDMPVEKIRSEVDILLEPGSTRRVNRDQEVNDRVNIMDRKVNYMNMLLQMITGGVIRDENGLAAILNFINRDLEDIADKLGWTNTHKATIPPEAFNLLPPPESGNQSFTIKEGDLTIKEGDLSIDEPNPSLSIDEPNPSLSIDEPNVSLDQSTRNSGGANGGAGTPQP